MSCSTAHQLYLHVCFKELKTAIFFVACGQPSKNKNMKYQQVHSDKPLSTVMQDLAVVDLDQYNNMLYKM